MALFVHYCCLHFSHPRCHTFSFGLSIHEIPCPRISRFFPQAAPRLPLPGLFHLSFDTCTFGISRTFPEDHVRASLRMSLLASASPDCRNPLSKSRNPLSNLVPSRIYPQHEFIHRTAAPSRRRRNLFILLYPIIALFLVSHTNFTRIMLSICSVLCFLFQLVQTAGVAPESIKFGTCSLQSDKYICVCQGGELVIVDMTAGNAVKRWPISAEAAIMNPTQKIVALRGL